MRWVGTAFLYVFFFPCTLIVLVPGAQSWEIEIVSIMPDEENHVSDDAKCIVSDSEQAETGLCKTDFYSSTVMGYSHHSGTCWADVLFLLYCNSIFFKK